VVFNISSTLGGRGVSLYVGVPRYASAYLSYAKSLGFTTSCNSLTSSLGVFRSAPVSTYPPTHTPSTLPKKASWGTPTIFSPLLPHVCARTPPSLSKGGLGSLLPPYCPCTHKLFKSRSTYKPIYFETADYGSLANIFNLLLHIFCYG